MCLCMKHTQIEREWACERRTDRQPKSEKENEKQVKKREYEDGWGGGEGDKVSNIAQYSSNFNESG